MSSVGYTTPDAPGTAMSRPTAWTVGDWDAPQGRSGLLPRRDFAVSRLPYQVDGVTVTGVGWRRPRSERALSAAVLSPADRDALAASLTLTDDVPPYPSAGSLYPVHPFLVTPVPDGDHAVVSYLDGDARRCRPVTQVASAVVADALFESWAWPVGCLLLLAVDFRRVRAVYGDRGLRFALLEAGSMSELWCRAAASVGIGTCAVGGFHDLRATQLVGLDPRFFGAALVVATGYPEQPVDSRPTTGHATGGRDATNAEEP